MNPYSFEPTYSTLIKGYGFTSFAKNMGKNISKNISKNWGKFSKYSQNLDHAKQTAKNTLKMLPKQQ